MFMRGTGIFIDRKEKSFTGTLMLCLLCRLLKAVFLVRRHRDYNYNLYWIKLGKRTLYTFWFVYMKRNINL